MQIFLSHFSYTKWKMTVSGVLHESLFGRAEVWYWFGIPLDSTFDNRLSLWKELKEVGCWYKVEKRLLGAYQD